MSDAEQAFQEARGIWREALRGHVLAPPDAGFSGRLAPLAAAAAQRAAACEAASHDGFEWLAARGGAKPPYELQPGSGRRGPEKFWTRPTRRQRDRRGLCATVATEVRPSVHIPLAVYGQRATPLADTPLHHKHEWQRQPGDAEPEFRAERVAAASQPDARAIARAGLCLASRCRLGQTLTR